MAISYLYNGEPMNGTANDDFVIAYKGSTGVDNNTIFGNGGDDLIIADSSDTWIPGASYLNGSIGTAFNLETLTSTWTTGENEMFGDWTIPHTTVICESTIGQSEFFRVAIGAGQQITIDIDFASNTAIGNPRDLVVELQDGVGNIIATADDSLVSDGGFGSVPSTPGAASSYDPYLTFTVATAGTYYINVRPFGSGPGSTFTDNNTFLMNLSVTGHAVSATDPVQGDDNVHGGDDNDTIFGQGGADTLSGDNGDDFISGGSGIDAISGGEGNDTIYGGDGTEEGAHGDNGNDTLVSGGEGHYYGDAGNDIIYAGLTAGINEILDGGADTDTVDTTTWNGTYVVNLVTGSTNFGESFTNFENIKTGNGADTITGTAGDNVITTQGGIDTVNAGDGNDVVSGGAQGDTLNGEGGTLDVLDYRTSSAAVTVNLATNSASGGDAAGDVISNFEGINGSVLGDNLTGSSGTNVLYGFEGNDTIDGGDGADFIDGGINNDTINGGAGSDTVWGGSGADTLDGGADKDFLDFRSVGAPVVVSLADGTWSGATFVNFEAVYGTGFGDTITGDGNNNELDGFAGNDTLDGGGGNDALLGGVGDDTYVVDSLGDTVTDLAGEGTDTVKSGVNWTLGLETENLILTGTSNLTGNGSNHSNTITGNTGNNTLNGNKGDDGISGNDGSDNIDGGAGNDTIDGGSGDDIMKGSDGNDTYFVNSTGDVVTDLAGEGTDLVQSTVSWTLGAQTENLTLLGNGPNFGIGNGLDNIINGNKGANILGGAGGDDTINGAGGGDTMDGGIGNDKLDGGAGNDTMAGGAGDDTYTVDSTSDVVTDNAGEGSDTVKSIVDWTLGAQTENLILQGGGNLAGTGNASDNVITGNNGNNALSGLFGNDVISGGQGGDNIDGGAGSDTLDGGAGNDIVVGGAGADSINAAGGSDTLIYTGITESQGPTYDTISVFDFQHADKFDLNVSVTGIDATVGAGHSLSQATFNADVAAAIGSGQLAAHHAVLFTPTAGDLAGSTFLIVDANGTAGFQGSGDYVFKLVSAAHIGGIDTTDFI